MEVRGKGREMEKTEKDRWREEGGREGEKAREKDTDKEGERQDKDRGRETIRKKRKNRSTKPINLQKSLP